MRHASDRYRNGTSSLSKAYDALLRRLDDPKDAARMASIVPHTDFQLCILRRGLYDPDKYGYATHRLLTSNRRLTQDFLAYVREFHTDEIFKTTRIPTSLPAAFRH